MIEFVNVTKQFSPPSVAVDDVSFTVVAGEFLTLLGPSGCGKTTILRMISGFELPTSGSIFLDGQEVFDAPPYKRDVNQVFQSYALFPHLNVARNIEFGLKMKRLPRAQRTERIEQAIAMLNLSGLESRKPSQLSGGQRQRVALARALVNRPKVLLLDEPLAALDAKLRKSVQIELKQLQRRLGITFVFVTHDQEEALTMSDRIAVMNGGKIEQLAAAQEIYHRPATAFVADFIGQTNLLRPREVRWDGGSLRVRIDDTIQLAVACDESPPDLSRVSLSIRPEKLRIDCDANTLNSFSARVTDRIFRGEVTQLILQCASGLELSAIVTERVDRPIEVGADLRCAIDPRDVVVLN